MAATSTSETLPVVEQGPFRRFASGAVLRYQPNRVVVLSGPGGYRIASAEEPLSLYDRLTESFTHYTIIDTAVKQASRTFTHAHSSDPRYTFDINVTMSAKVDDPIAFLKDFGPQASVFDAFYNELVEDVANTLSDCPINDLVGTQQRLSDYARDIKKDQPFYKGVKIQQFNAVVKYGPELIRKLEEYDIKRLLHREGEQGLIIQAALDPTRAAQNEAIKKGLRESNEYHHKQAKSQSMDAMELAEQFAQRFNIDPRTVVEQSGLSQRLNIAIAPPAARTEPKSLLFSEQSGEKRIPESTGGRRPDGGS